MSGYCEHPSSFGKLSPAQQAVVRRFVSGKTVLDLGAGTFELSRCLVDLGAEHVIAVERSTRERGRLEIGTPYERVRVLPSNLSALGRVARRAGRRGVEPPASHRRAQVAFVSWPSPSGRMYSPAPDFAILEPVRKAQVVVYLGSNLDGTICGSPTLYQHLARREVLAHEPEKRNTLIVYGKLLPRGRVRERLPEEQAGIDTSKIYYSSKVYRPVDAMEVFLGTGAKPR
jgi:hypothetical protein